MKDKCREEKKRKEVKLLHYMFLLLSSGALEMVVIDGRVDVSIVLQVIHSLSELVFPKSSAQSLAKCIKAESGILVKNIVGVECVEGSLHARAHAAHGATAVVLTCVSLRGRPLLVTSA